MLALLAGGVATRDISQIKTNITNRFVRCLPAGHSKNVVLVVLVVVKKQNDNHNIPLEPRRLLLCYSPLLLIFSGAHDCLRQLSPKTVNKKSVSAASASLKIGCSSLKGRNLSPFHSAVEQPAFLRSATLIFLTLTSRCGNQGIATQ